MIALNKAQATAETKFAIDSDARVPDLTGVVPGARIIRRPEVRLDATCFDTSDLRLLRRGLTLCHCHEGTGGGGGEWALRAAAMNEPDHAKGDRTDASWPGALDLIPAEAERFTRGLTLGDALHPIVAIVTYRSRTEIRDASGRRLIEIIDDNTTTTATVPSRNHVLDIKLHAGDPAVIAEVVHRLRPHRVGGPPHGPPLEAIFGEALAESSSPPPLGAGSTVADVITTSIGSTLERLRSHDIGLRLDRGPTHVHRARVATRRLRSVLKTFRATLDPRWVADTRAELKWLGSTLGDVRDSDVLARRIAEHMDRPDVDPNVRSELGPRLSEEHQVIFSRLQQALESARYVALLRSLDQATSMLPFNQRTDPDQLAKDVLPRLVRKPWRKLRSTVRKLDTIPSDEDLHAVRIRAKELRYAAEAVAPMVGAPAKRVAKRAQRLQSVLGDHHDAVAAERWLRRSAWTGTTRQAFAAGQLLSVERRLQTEGREQWPLTWKRIEATHLDKWGH